MTNKQKILRMMKNWPEDISFEQAAYHLDVLRGIEHGLEEIRQGRYRDAEEVFDELLGEHAKENSKDKPHRNGEKRVERDSRLHSSRLEKKRPGSKSKNQKSHPRSS